MKTIALLGLTGAVYLTGSNAAESATNNSPSGRDVIAAEVPERETGFERDHMTGDWGGLRSKLVDRGVHLQAGYIGEVIGNVSGGLKRGAIYQGLFEAGLHLNTKKAGLWEGGTFQVSTLFPHGTEFSADYPGDLLTASNIEGYESWRLYDLYYEHQFGKHFSVRIGQFAADEEFAFTKSGSDFINSAFGWAAFISANTVNTGPAFYVAAPGIRFNIEPTDEFFLRIAVFDGDTFDNREGDPRANRSGTRFEVGGDQGYFGIGETGLRWHSGEKGENLPGELKVGGWLHTTDFESNFEDDAGEPFVVTGRAPRQHSKNIGVYVAAQQMLWREKEDQGVQAFARAGASPQERSFFEVVVDGGLTWEGMIPTRDDDILGLGIAYARISRDIVRRERLDSETNGTQYPAYSSHETVLEGFYTLKLNPWWTVQPDVQWIFNPGGNESVPDAVVAILRTSLVF
jgi:porin